MLFSRIAVVAIIFTIISAHAGRADSNQIPAGVFVPQDRTCAIERFSISVEGDTVITRREGKYLGLGDGPFDFTEKYPGVNTNHYQMHMSPNAVTEMTRIVFRNGQLEIQKKSRTEIMPVPWFLISWETKEVIFTVINQDEIGWGINSNGACQMVRQ